MLQRLLSNRLGNAQAARLPQPCLAAKLRKPSISLRVRRCGICRAKDSQFAQLYAEFSIASKEDSRALPNEGLFDIVYEISSADEAAKVLGLLQEDVVKREIKLQNDWPFRKKIYALLVEKAAEHNAFKVVAQLVDSMDSMLLEKYFVKELIRQLALQKAPVEQLEKLVEILGGHTKKNPALLKGLRGAYYELLLTCKNRGLVEKEAQLYQAAKAAGVTFSEAYTKKMERGSKVQMVTIAA